MKKLIILGVILVMVGCSQREEPKQKEISLRIIVNQCPEGWEWVDQTVYGVRRAGCYPVDFGYEVANKRLAEHLARERQKKQNETL